MTRLPNRSSIDLSALRRTEARTEEEGLFARDVNGQLIRLEKASTSDFDLDVTLSIDGHQVTVKKAVPQLDSQGNVIRDVHGQPTPRYTTIFDAAQQVFVKRAGDQNPIPTLCHREHLPPVGVCRVCMVEAVEQSKYGLRRKFVPACIQQVSQGMEIHTVDSKADGDAALRVHAAVSVLTELLMSDHLPQNLESSESVLASNELAQLAKRLELTECRFLPTPSSRPTDISSQMITVDHSQCILCGRCNRGCNWVKQNRVIGRSGKGYATLISFDLDDPMGDSSCVNCGECAISCPTGALEFKQSFLEVKTTYELQDRQDEKSDGEIVPIAELMKHPLFRNIPYKFLQLNATSIVRRKLQPGDVLCREGEYGNTAFIIVDGKLKIRLDSTRGRVKTDRATGVAGFFGALRTVSQLMGINKKHIGDVGDADGFRTKEDVIIGEMTCMNRYPRSATVTAAETTELLEIRRNVLQMLQRNEVSRKILNDVYRVRSLDGRLAELPFLQDLNAQQRQAATTFLRERAELILVDPGQTIFAQGDTARDFFVVKLGFVKVSVRFGRDEQVLNYLGPGKYFGEIGLLTDLNLASVTELGEGLEAGKRMASCTALDHVELVKISSDDFNELLQTFPELQAPFLAAAKLILSNNREAEKRFKQTTGEDFLSQGLLGAQKLLVLDLERCTRCDECTKACADTHDGVTRLVRDGLRFDKFLVASACRSCLDPYCLVGCPVDAIHRDGSTLEIDIDDYCIGCGLCASNCPYGNINMHGFPKMEVDPHTNKTRRAYQEVEGRKLPVVQQRATTCDLCRSIDSQPSCVYACPHNAAFRMSGEQLLKIVEKDGFAALG